MDNLDKAAETEDLYRNNAIKQNRTHLVSCPATECEECGESIGDVRKKVMPSARLCLSCQVLLEARSGV